MQTEQPAAISVTSRSLLVPALAMMALASPALASNFGVVRLQGGETQTVSIFGPGGFSRVRVCNDATSVSNVKVTIRPRDPRLLQPGMCTVNTGDQIEFANQGSGQARVNFNPAPGAGYGSGRGMFGNNSRVFRP
jgi:hypothetical protein